MPHETPTLPRLTNLRLLGSGGFADVYEARQEHLGRWVAAKVFRDPLHERGAGDAFRSECQVVMRLDPHPHVLTVHDVDVLPDGRPYLVMERCDTSLQRRLEDGPLAPDRVAAIGVAVAGALQHAHAERIVHGDVTPSNVLLRGGYTPVLADFGLSVLRDVRGNVAHGFTITHTAPETLRVDGAVDERADVYGLGSTLATALTGRAPFAARPGESDAERVTRILTRDPELPSAFGDLLARMLAKDPERRPGLHEVIAGLEGGFGAEQPRFLPPPELSRPATPKPSVSPPSRPSWVAPPEVTGRRATGADGPASVAAAEETRLRARPDAEPPAARTGRPRWVLPAAVGGVAVVVIGVVLALWQPWRDDAPPSSPTPAGAAVALAAPVDRGRAVDLSWSGPQGYDYAVVVAGANDPGNATLVGRVDRYTVPVDPVKPYCFRVQAANEAGTVLQSKVVGIRDAVCRFAD